MTEKSPKQKSSVSKSPFKFFEKNRNNNSLEGRCQRKLQTAVSGTEHTVTTETGKQYTENLFRNQSYFCKKQKQSVHRRLQIQ